MQKSKKNLKRKKIFLIILFDTQILPTFQFYRLSRLFFKFSMCIENRARTNSLTHVEVTPHRECACILIDKTVHNKTNLCLRIAVYLFQMVKCENNSEYGSLRNANYNQSCFVIPRMC